MFTTYYPNGQCQIVENRVERLRKGKVLIYNSTGQKISTMTYRNGRVDSIEYQQNNTLHNEHGPACISWSTNRKIYRISYWQNDLRHNLHGPAYMELYNGKIIIIKYCQNGIVHNLQGPAFILGSPNGKIYRNDFYHFGKLIKEYDY